MKNADTKECFAERNTVYLKVAIHILNAHLSWVKKFGIAQAVLLNGYQINKTEIKYISIDDPPPQTL